MDSTSLFLVAVVDGDDPERRCLRDSRTSDRPGWGWLAPQLGLQFGPLVLGDELLDGVDDPTYLSHHAGLVVLALVLAQCLCKLEGGFRSDRLEVLALAFALWW